VGLLVGKQDVAGELLLLCGVLVVIAAGREGWLRWRRRG